MKNCRRCGAQLQDTANFCEVCGEKCVPNDYRNAQHQWNRGQKRGDNWIPIIGILAVALLLGSFLVCSINREPEKETDAPETVQETRSVSVPASEDTIPVSEVVEVPETQAAVPTQATNPTKETQGSADTSIVMTEDPLIYFVENCDKVYMTWDDLSGFDEWACVLARNACYAKSGRMFNDYRLQEFFGQFAWYEPTISPGSFSDSLLNDYQLANIGLVLEYEQMFN